MTIKKQRRDSILALVNGTPGQPNQYGNRLLRNFPDLWIFTNKFNPESLLEGSHSSQSYSDWGFWGAVMMKVIPRSKWFAREVIRIEPNTPDIYTSGWSFNVWTKNFYDLMKTDPRFSATVLNVKALATTGKAKYIEGYQNTGYF